MAGFYFSTQNNDYFYNNINGEVSVVPPNEYAGHNGARRPRKWCSQTA